MFRIIWQFANVVSRCENTFFINKYSFYYYYLAACEPCGRPEIPHGGYLSLPTSTSDISHIQSYATGESVTVRCGTGLILLHGNLVRQCINGTWSGSSPLCVGKYTRVE